MKTIPLTQGKVAIVDDWWFDYLNQWKWCVSSNGYPVRCGDRTKGVSKRDTIYMHRIVNQTPDGFETDHIDIDKLNNQEINLRTATTSQNHANMKVFPTNLLGTKGVSYCENRGYRARIIVNKNNIHLGYFETIEEAKAAYDQAAREHFGEYAHE